MGLRRTRPCMPRPSAVKSTIAKVHGAGDPCKVTRRRGSLQSSTVLRRNPLRVNLHFAEGSDISSVVHFADLAQGNASRYAPSPEIHLEKNRPQGATEGELRQTRVAQRTPGATPHHPPHARTRRNNITRSGGTPPLSEVKVLKLYVKVASRTFFGNVEL